VFEKETGMGDVKLLALQEGWHLDITLSHVEEMAFVIDLSLAQSSADLLFAAFDPDSWDASRSRHSAGELAEASAEVDHTLALQELSLRQAGVVDEPVHDTQALLFSLVSAMGVV